MWRRETGAANIWITHTRADERRERGSSALRGAADTMISMLPTDDVVSLRCDKQKDAEPSPRCCSRRWRCPKPRAASCGWHPTWCHPGS